MRRSRTMKRRGATSVEFALIAPILFSTFMVSLEFCRAHMIRHSLENAVYESARLGLVPQTSDQDIRDAATRMMQAVSVQNASVIVNQTAEQVSVQINVPFKDAAWVTPIVFKTTTLSARITLVKDEV